MPLARQSLCSHVPLSVPLLLLLTSCKPPLCPSHALPRPPPFFLECLSLLPSSPLFLFLFDSPPPILLAPPPLCTQKCPCVYVVSGRLPEARHSSGQCYHRGLGAMTSPVGVGSATHQHGMRGHGLHTLLSPPQHVTHRPTHAHPPPLLALLPHQAEREDLSAPATRHRT